jgi:hypothetical protein
LSSNTEYIDTCLNTFCWNRIILGGELDNLQIPVGGDQLTRERFQGAKTLRAGAHTRQERFDQLYPMIIELFHTLQDFLEVVIGTLTT